MSRSQADKETLKQKIVAVVLDVAWKRCGNRQEESSSWRSQIKELVIRSVLVREPTHSKFYDIQIKLATTLFHRFHSGCSLLLVSDYGVAREFRTIRQLAQALLPDIELECREFSHHVRLDPSSSFICILTYFYQKPLEHSCPQCPIIVQNAKALRWHLFHQHQQSYKHATQSVVHQESRDTNAMVVYDPEQQQHKVHAINPAAPPTNSSAETNDNTIVSDPFSVVQRGGTMADLEEILQHKKLLDPFTLRDKNGALLIHWASGLGNTDLLEALLHVSPPLTTPQCHSKYKGRTCLHWAARGGHVDTVALILNKCPACIEAYTADGTTAFDWAAWQGHANVLQLLYDHGCNVNNTNQFGCNAVLWASQGLASVQTMEWLGGVGCDLFLINHAGHGVLHKSAQRGRQDLCEWFLNVLLKSKRDIHAALAPDAVGAAPSDMAAMEGHMGLAEYLAKEEDFCCRKLTSESIQ